MLMFIMAAFFSCNQAVEPKERSYSEKEMEKPLFDANKKAVKVEDQQIRDFISRYHWQVLETGTGLRYLIYKNGAGEQAQVGEIARIAYTVSLLNGDVIYSSETNGIKEFEIGRGGVESGLEEGILLLHQGDHAKFILPSHLAFGLLGDQDKVPPKTTLIYDVNLIEIK